MSWLKNKKLAIVLVLALGGFAWYAWKSNLSLSQSAKKYTPGDLDPPPVSDQRPFVPNAVPPPLSGQRPAVPNTGPPRTPTTSQSTTLSDAEWRRRFEEERRRK